ncbi:MAG: hypothetical protein ACXQTE_05205 [Methanosarcinaceae archaeon]
MTDFIISDLHVPFQDPEALKLMLKMQQHFRPTNVIMDGDMLDAIQLSKFSKDPQEPESFKANVVELCIILRKMQKYSNLIYIEGNHEARLQRYINDRAPDLAGLISIEGLIKSHLGDTIEYIRTTPGESMMTWGAEDDLLIGHFAKVSKHTCYTVKLLVEKYMTNVVQAHTHRLGQYALRGYDHTFRGFESGCLCNLDPDYVAKPNWQQGFLVYSSVQGRWNIESVTIHDGAANFRGKIWKV